MCEHRCIKTKELQTKLYRIKKYVSKLKIDLLDKLNNQDDKLYMSGALGYILDIIKEDENENS